jgi:hypothetical protein
VNDASVTLTTEGPPDTVLPPEAPAIAAAIVAARMLPEEERRAAFAKIVSAHPRSIEGWAHLAEAARDSVEQYAYFRVGYHRGLDLLRQNGWRGSGYVRWSHISNRGFLRCLDGLRAAAAIIGETDEAERCNEFLHQLDPNWDRRTDPQ